MNLSEHRVSMQSATDGRAKLSRWAQYARVVLPPLKEEKKKLMAAAALMVVGVSLQLPLALVLVRFGFG